MGDIRDVRAAYFITDLKLTDTHILVERLTPFDQRRHRHCMQCSCYSYSNRNSQRSTKRHPYFHTDSTSAHCPFLQGMTQSLWGDEPQSNMVGTSTYTKQHRYIHRKVTNIRGKRGSDRCRWHLFTNSVPCGAIFAIDSDDLMWWIRGILNSKKGLNDWICCVFTCNTKFPLKRPATSWRVKNRRRPQTSREWKKWPEGPFRSF